MNILHVGPHHRHLSLLGNGCPGDHIPLGQPRLPQIRSPLPSPDSLEKPPFERRPLQNPNDNPHESQGRAQAGEPDPGCRAHMQAPVEARGLGVHEEEVSFAKRLDFTGGGETDREGGDACSQRQDAHGQGHLGGDRSFVSVTDLRKIKAICQKMFLSNCL